MTQTQCVETFRKTNLNTFAKVCVLDLVQLDYDLEVESKTHTLWLIGLLKQKQSRFGQAVSWIKIHKIST